MALYREGSRDFYKHNSLETSIQGFTKQRLLLLPNTHFQITKINNSEALTLNSKTHWFRQHKQALAALCKVPELEQRILEEIDIQTRTETLETIKKGQLFMECLIVGTGPAGVSLALRLRELHPNANIWMVDERDYRGGQFADEGYNFLLNTPRQGELGFAGELSEPNNLGNAAILQVVDITDDVEYPRRKKLATCLKIDGFIAAPALVGVKVSSVDIGHSGSSYVVNALHKDTGKSITLLPQVIAFARGRGKPKFGIDISTPDTQETLVRRGDRIYVSEVYNSHLDILSPGEVLCEVKNRLAIIGAGDSANTTLDAIISKLLFVLSPQEIQRLSIDVYGAKYANASEFESAIGIHRYDAIIPYIGNLIRPHKEKAEELMVVGKESIGITTQTSLGIYNTVAITAGYQNVPIESIVHKSTGVKLTNIFGENELEGEIIAQQIAKENIFTIGVDVREPFPDKPPLFARSIVRLTPRILAIAEKIAEQIP